MDITDEERHYLGVLEAAGYVVHVTKRYRGHLYAYVQERAVPGVDTEVPAGVRLYVLPPHDPVLLVERPCVACGRVADGWDSPDPCVGYLDDVDAACCGHGGSMTPYVVFSFGTAYGGPEAIARINASCRLDNLSG